MPGSGGWPDLPEPLPVAVTDSHCHLDTVYEPGQHESGLPVDDALRLAESVGVTKVVQVGYDVDSFEDKIYELYRAGALKGASHLSAGQEAVPAGAVAAITPRDLVASTHRGHGHCGAMGNLMAASEADRQAHWNAMMAELFGKTTGYCRGRGGSMHIADVEHGNLGATGIVAGNIPMKTQVASVYVYGEIESYNPQGATSVSIAILMLSLLVLVLLERLTRPPLLRRAAGFSSTKAALVPSS